MSDFKASLDRWVREAAYSLPNREVEELLEAALAGIRPQARPVLLRRGRSTVAATAPLPTSGKRRRGRPKGSLGQPKPETEQPEGEPDAV